MQNVFLKVIYSFLKAFLKAVHFFLKAIRIFLKAVHFFLGLHGDLFLKTILNIITIRNTIQI